MKIGLCILVLMINAWVSVSWARSVDDLQILSYTTGVKLDAALVRPHVLAEPQWSPVLRAAVIRLEKQLGGAEGCTRRDVLAFHGGRFLASTWVCEVNQVFAMHRLSQGRLTPILRLQDDRVSMVEPSGLDVFPDHVPAVFVDVGSGGSGYDGYAQHVFRIESHGVKEVTPDLRTPWVDVVDGRLMAMSSDDRWASFVIGCGQCGPFVPVVQEWRDGAFRTACKTWPKLILDRLDAQDRFIALAEQENFPLRVMDERLKKALLLLQLGRGAEGGALFDEVMTRLRNEQKQELVAQDPRFQRAFTDHVAAAAKNTAAQCPLSESRSMGASPGLTGQVDR